MGIFDFLKSNKEETVESSKYLSGFKNTNDALGRKIKFITENYTHSQEDFIEQLMITLIEADIGYSTADTICDMVYKRCSSAMRVTASQLLDMVVECIEKLYLKKPDAPINYNEDGTTVILMVGVNGSGKTSSCAKLANKYLSEGKSVAFVAGDTFRAGASEQLGEWAKRLGIECIKGKENQDPSSVMVDGCRYAKEHNIDILICDTSGRLQNKVNLMAELDKMNRVIGREIPGAPHNTWIVLDANTGQNGLSQAENFASIVDVNGVILTKVDGTSKGGIVIAIKNITGIPVRYLTFGEGLDEISEFDLNLYLYSICEELKHAR
ncbi:MAG: signal recognition particle-docking protein FtsY [Erysipelotrichaceae bacterium]|nr:signal recognition particle-docking protein FtsY [Erysipelotrichaceae bacterium]